MTHHWRHNPNLEDESTHGKIKLYHYFDDNEAIIFSHPSDFTPVCTTEIRKMAKYSRKFQEKGVKFVGLSCDDLPSYLRYGSAKKRPMREPYFLSKVKLSFLYPASIGWNMEEVMRVLESLQKANTHKVATLTNWKWGDPVVISPSVSQDEANKMFPPSYKTVDLPSKKKYLRFTDV
ncbi:unnamed protein product [Malus baccata var. baccata]